jgi:hypothetical protein
MEDNVVAIALHLDSLHPGVDLQPVGAKILFERGGDGFVLER